MINFAPKRNAMSTKNTIDLKYLRSIKAIVYLQGREYITHPGLLRVAHEHGLKSIHNELVDWNPEGRAAVVKATASGTRGVYSAYGDANPKNVGRMVVESTLRMAETRAVNRALRLYTGLGMTTTEELPGDHDSASPASTHLNRTSSSKAFRTPTMVDTQASGCAVCGKLVSNAQAKASQDEHKLVMCEEHAQVWGQDPHGSWAVDVAAFIDAIGDIGVELDALDLRCMASPRWGQRPKHMTRSQRETMLKTLVAHYARNREQ